MISEFCETTEIVRSDNVFLLLATIKNEKSNLIFDSRRKKKTNKQGVTDLRK